MTSDTSDVAGVIALPPLIYLAFILLGVALDRFWPVAVLPGSAQYAIGGLSIMAGLALAAWSLPLFRKLGTSVNVYRPTTALITTGPYRFARNPLYLSLALAQAGIAFAADNVWIMALLVPTIVVVNYGVIAREERYLEAKFGDEYRRYRAAARRWL